MENTKIVSLRAKTDNGVVVETDDPKSLTNLDKFTEFEVTYTKKVGREVLEEMIKQLR